MSRRDNLEQLIRDQERLILEHEQIIQTTDRPEERLNSQRRLQFHRALLEQYRAELAALPVEARLAYPGGPIPTIIPSPRVGRLIGRQKELAWLCARLRADAGMPAVVAVRGLGGIGKSELAIAAARALSDHFEGRVIWLDGGPNGVEAIQDRLAAALGIELPPPGAPLRDDTLAYVLRRQRPTLIVFDDLRRAHFDRWHALCPPCPPCAALITTRRADLPLPPRAVLHLNALPAAEAVELLAFLLPPGQADAEPQAAAEIVALLDGVPLALMVAAHRAARLSRAVHPLATLLDELRAHRERVLNQADRPERRDLSVFLTFDLSFDDLDPPDRDRLRRLGVFARSEFDLPALAHVWETTEEDARAAAGRLIDAGLLEEIEPDEWWMHDLLRAHAADRLRADPTAERAACLAHAAYCQSWLDDFDPRSPEDWQQLNVRRPEIETAAVRLLEERQGDPAPAARLALAIVQTFPSSALVRSVDWLCAGLSAAQDRQRAAENEPERQTWDRMVAELQSGLAVLLDIRGEYDGAEQLYRQSLHALDALDCRRQMAVTRSRFATLLSKRGQSDAAERLYHESLGIFEALGDRRSAAQTQSLLADLLSTRGRYDEAERLYRQSLLVFKALDDRRSMAVVQSDWADVLNVRGQYEAAEQLYRESLSVFEALGDRRSGATTQAKLATLLNRRGQCQEAEWLYRESLGIFEALGDRRSAAETQSRLADLLSIRGQYDQAERLYRASLLVFQLLDDRRSTAVTQSRLATLLNRRGQCREAERLYRESLVFLETLGDRREIAVVQANLADLLGTRGQYAEAEQLYRQSLPILEALGDRKSLAAAQGNLADLLCARGQYDQAGQLYRQSLSVFEMLDAPRSVAVARSKLADLLCACGQYDEAEQLYHTGLAIIQQLGDVQNIAIFLIKLARLALARGHPSEAIPLLQEARKRFETIGLSDWVALVDRLLAKAQSTDASSAPPVEPVVN